MVNNVLANAKCQLRKGLEAINKMGFYQMLSQPQQSLLVSLPIMMDNGTIEVFKGYRVLHSNLRGPGKGGIRFAPVVDLEEVSALAMWMAWKTACVNIPLGGAKGGIAVDPNKLSRRELEKLTRRYTASIADVLGPEKDIPAPDINTNPQIMAWIYDTYSCLKGVNTPGVVTGKPLPVGGIIGRIEATGRGVSLVTEEYVKNVQKWDLEKTTVAVQGFGNVGSIAAKYLAKLGVKIQAVSDVNGGLYNPDGIDIPALMKHYSENMSFEGFSGADTFDKNQILTLDVDVLLPAAIENQITEENGDEIQAKVIVEGANGPTTNAGEKILLEKKIEVLPDILVNSGGVIVSYFEWVQDLNKIRWDLARVNSEMQKIILNAFSEVRAITLENKKKRGIDYRLGAYELALSRVVHAFEYRGIWP